MYTRAKFFVTQRTELCDNMFSIRLEPVTCGSEENKKFFKHTPYGSFELNTINTDSAKEFNPGREFYVDFTPAD